MKQNITISIPSNVVEDHGFVRLKEARKLSSVISELLYNYLQMNRSDNKDIKKLENQLEKNNTKNAMLLDQIEKLRDQEKEDLAKKKLEQEEAEKIVDGIKMSGMMRDL